MALCVKNKAVGLAYIGDGSGVPVKAQWKIFREGSGYAFHYTTTSAGEQCMCPDGTNVVTSTFIYNHPGFIWTLTPDTSVVNQVLLLNTQNGLPANNAWRNIEPDETAALADFSLIASVVSRSINNQTVHWNSSNPSVATVNSATGTVTGRSVGKTTITASSEDAFNVVSYKLIVSEIPVSGYELEYNTAIWNDNGMYQYTNCYAYILNNQYDPTHNGYGYNCTDGKPKQQPGDFYNANTSNTNDRVDIDSLLYDAENIIDAVEKDFQKYNEIFGTNLIFREIGRDEKCPAGTYKVALCLMPYSEQYYADYHWYRQNADGTWSHKQGLTSVKKTDGDNMIITDPEKAGESVGYTEFVGYFAVSPWNNIWFGTDTAMVAAETEPADVT